MIRMLSLLAYYSVAVHLPDTWFPGGRLSNGIRCTLLSLIIRDIGTKNDIGGNIYIGDGSDVVIGSNCQINRGCRFNRVTIGDFVMIGPDTVVLQNPHVTDSANRPMAEQGKRGSRQTIIERDVFIGGRVVIMPGIRIGRGSVVGAGAVVTHDVPDYAVVVGVPARVVKMRTA